MILVREASPEDNILLAELGVETFRDAFGQDNAPGDMELYLTLSFGPAIQSAELADPDSLFLIAEIDAQPVGYAKLREGAPPAPLDTRSPVEIVRFYARTQWIGRKVGAALMEACLSAAAARGGTAIWLAVWEKNARAISFYRKWGFVEIGSQLFRLGKDLQNDLIMARAVGGGEQEPVRTQSSGR